MIGRKLGVYLISGILVATTGCQTIGKKNNTQEQLTTPYHIEQLLDGKYDKNNFLVNNPALAGREQMDFRKIERSLYDVMTIPSMKDAEEYGLEDLLVQLGKTGKAVAINDEYLMTVSHVGKPIPKGPLVKYLGEPDGDADLKELIAAYLKDHPKPEVRDYGRTYLMISKGNLDNSPGNHCNDSDIDSESKCEDARFIEVEEVLRDDGLDLVIYRIPKDELPAGTQINPFPYEFGRGSELEVGDLVYTIGYPFHIGTNVRDGMVSMYHPPVGMGGEGGSLNESDIVVSVPTSGGDSGTTVVAVRDGKYELIGLAKSVVGGNHAIAFVANIDDIVKKINEEGPEDLKKIVNSKVYKP